jgi:hypothetical protein
MTQPNEIQLKGLFTTRDRRLDCLPSRDPRNVNFKMRRLVAQQQVARSFIWSVGRRRAEQVHLDQGQEGACVGFAFAHELIAMPYSYPFITDIQADIIYRGAQKEDEWPGEAYEGTSVLGAAKYMTDKGFYQSYAWSKDAREVAVTVSRKGPVVLGVNWYEGMYDTDKYGYVAPTGEVSGGHSILCKGYSLPRDAFLLHNSWGAGWGIRNKDYEGCAWILASDLQRLLDEGGDACMPLRMPYDVLRLW